MAEPVDLSGIHRELDLVKRAVCHCQLRGECLGCKGIEMVRQQMEAVVAAASQPVLLQVAQETAAKEMLTQFSQMQERLIDVYKRQACIKDDELAAGASGIPIIRYKLYAYMSGAVWAGLAGAIFAVKQTIVSPETFTFDQSFFAVAVVIMGGMGSIPGVILGAVIYVVIAEWLSTYTGTFSGVIFAGALLLIVLLRPQGLIPYRPRPPRWLLRHYSEEPPPETADVPELDV